MKITKLQISNFVGLEEYTLDAGKFNLITGHNGAGKTSILRAIKAALGGGDHAELIRNGAESAEIVLIFDTGQQLRTVFKHDQPPRRSGTEANGAPMRKLQTWIDERLELNSFNPVAFILADEKERLKWLLKVAPLKLTPKELVNTALPYETVGMLSPDLINQDGVYKNPLDALSSVRTKIYDERTGVNRIVNDRKTTIETLSLTLSSNTMPDGEPADVLKVYRGKLEEVRGQRLTYSKAIDKAENEALQERKDAAQVRIDKVKAEAERRIEAIRGELRVESDKIRADAKKESQAREDELSAAESPIVSEIGRLEEVALRASKDAHTRRQIESFNVDFAANEKRALELTGALANLDKLRTQLLEQLPLKGLEVRDGKLFWRDVDYNSLNEANQVMVACRLAEVAAKDIGLVCVEGIHKMLDSKRREAFMKWAMKSELQFFVTAVDDNPLTVQTEKTL